jgi:hypothetical protein
MMPTDLASVQKSETDAVFQSVRFNEQRKKPNLRLFLFQQIWAWTKDLGKPGPAGRRRIRMNLSEPD